jgi:hypothetical protein
MFLEVWRRCNGEGGAVGNAGLRAMELDRGCIADVADMAMQKTRRKHRRRRKKKTKKKKKKWSLVRIPLVLFHEKNTRHSQDKLQIDAIKKLWSKSFVFQLDRSGAKS